MANTAASLVPPRCLLREPAAAVARPTSIVVKSGHSADAAQWTYLGFPAPVGGRWVGVRFKLAVAAK